MISELAIIDPSAKIGKNVSIGPFSLIGANVEIGDDCVIGSHVVIKGPTKMGSNNKIFQFASIGEDCQDKKYNGEHTELVIGNNNTFREGCTVHRGTTHDQGITRVGNNNYFMAYSHIAHDCQIGNEVTFANNVAAAGHVRIGDYVTLGGFVGVHQFVTIGAYSFIAAGTMVNKDVAPFVMINGRGDARVFGLNTVGLARRNFSAEAINHLKQAYKIVFRTTNTVSEALAQLPALIEQCPELALMHDFLLQSARGVTR